MTAIAAHRQFSHHRGSGYSLVEVLAALVAGLVLSASLMQAFLSSKQTFRLGDQLSRLQENSRHAIDLLTQELRMAGSLGCASGSRRQILTTLQAADTLYYDFGTPLEGFEAVGTAPGQSYRIKSATPAPSTDAKAWNPPLPAASPALLGDVIEGSDILVIRGRRGETSDLVQLTDTDLTVQRLPDGLKAGDLALVADCALTRVFQVSGLKGRRIEHLGGGSPGNACSEWNATDSAHPCRRYPFPLRGAADGGAPAEVAEVATTLFFVSRRDKTSRDPNPGPSLYRRVGANPKDELVEGVESLQVLYGVLVDPGQGTVRFYPASELYDPVTRQPRRANARIVSVRIGLLLRSIDEVATGIDTSSYEVIGTTIDPADDRRLRRVVMATIGIRSHLD